MAALTRRGMALAGIALGGSMVAWGVRGAMRDGIVHAQAVSAAEAGQSYGKKIAGSYNYRFGAGEMSLPGNAAVSENAFLPASAFPDAAYCGHCHQEAYREWRQALHSNSFRTPFYRRSVNLLVNTRGVEFARHCDSCHNPIGVVSGALTEGSSADRTFDRDGVTCSVCHSIQKLQAETGNGSYVIGMPAVMVDEQGNRIPGKVPDAEILAHPERHARAVMQDFYHTSEYCGACHKASLPTILNGYKWIRAFTTYDEWQNSKFSHENPLTFYTADKATCQGCHMKRETAGMPDYGAKHGTLTSHRWLAGNTAVPYYYGFSDQLSKTEQFLKTGNYLNVDLFGLEDEDTGKLAAPLGTAPFTVRPGERAQAFVVVQSRLIGHSLVPEVRDLYEAWVEFELKDAAGREIMHSGFLKPDGMLDRRAHSFTNRPVDATGDFVDDHQVWAIHSVAYDNSIQAGSSALVRYEFRVPVDAKGPLTMTARVNYRHLRQSYLNNVFGPDHPAYPVVEMAARTRVLQLGKNPAAAPAPEDNPDWMRWNNLGIAYLDQLQYGDAMAAFEEVVKLRPEYKDGYINVALTDIDWEKYADARLPLEKALKLAPGDARALYYLALVERRADHPEAEVADLRQVIAEYPRCRDARRELGISYYQQHRLEDSMEEFQALQAIDPDDLAAHYNLAILYRRMGMKSKAAQEAKQYVAKRVDPGAPTYSLEYLRKHPEISVESVPWHVHSDLAPMAKAAGAGQP